MSTATVTQDMTGRLTTPADVKNFMLAGNATITIRSIRTGARFTFRVKNSDLADKKSVFFVSLMNGPDNESNFQYMGIIRRDNKGEVDLSSFQRTAKSKVGIDAPSMKAFQWLIDTLSAAPIFLDSRCEIWHEGKCGRCGRKLTVPESIQRGIGPDCITKM